MGACFRAQPTGWRRFGTGTSTKSVLWPAGALLGSTMVGLQT